MAYMNKDSEKLSVIYGDCTLSVKGEDFHYIFSYAAGGLESLNVRGREWLYRVPRPAFWRALTDNDRGNGLHLKSGMWLAADMFLRCKDISVKVNGEKIELPKPPVNNAFTGKEEADTISIRFRYETITTPATIVNVTYIVEGSGRMKVKVKYNGKKGLPELPVFGMRFVMPTMAEGFAYEGLSGETYPDRMAGGIYGTYEIKGLPVTNYLVPQDCGVHMETKWLEVYRKETASNVTKGILAQKKERFSLRFEAQESPFAFSCLPYTPEELENATHQEELPPARRTVVSILGAVRGVGGINSWGADVEEGCRISGEKDIKYSFVITF